MRLVLTDPHYNTGREEQRSNPTEDFLSEEDLAAFTEIVQEGFHRGGYAFLFLTSYQFRR